MWPWAALRPAADGPLVHQRVVAAACEAATTLLARA
jgi:hypothetical protein